MTEYLKKSFTVGMPTGQKYRDNWDAIFGKRDASRHTLSLDGTRALCADVVGEIRWGSLVVLCDCGGVRPVEAPPHGKKAEAEAREVAAKGPRPHTEEACITCPACEEWDTRGFDVAGFHRRPPSEPKHDEQCGIHDPIEEDRGGQCDCGVFANMKPEP